jgi:hypothetical protein
MRCAVLFCIHTLFFLFALKSNGQIIYGRKVNGKAGRQAAAVNRFCVTIIIIFIILLF